MSRLDYITIAIVAACILAIIFLVYKMTDLFNDKPVVDPVETETGKVEQEDSTYNYNIDEDSTTSGEASTDTENVSSTGASANTENNDPSTSSTTKSDEEEEKAPPPTNTNTPSPINTPSSGKYMVIAGTFSQKESAKRQLQKLKKMGYNNAAIEPFDKGKYDVVLVDRFDNMAAAERLVKDLKAENVSSYVKAKERNQ